MAARSSGPCGLSAGFSARGSERPTTRPPLDAAAAQGDGERRAPSDRGRRRWLMRGVRPNSPDTTTSVVSSRPRSLRSRKKRGQRRVERGSEAVLERPEVVVVRVPVAMVDRHAADAGLDQPAGHQARLAERVPAVVVAEPGRPPRRCRTPTCAAGDAMRSNAFWRKTPTVLGVTVRLDLGRALKAVDLVQEPLAVVEPTGGDRPAAGRCRAR